MITVARFHYCRKCALGNANVKYTEWIHVLLRSHEALHFRNMLQNCNRNTFFPFPGHVALLSCVTWYVM